VDAAEREIRTGLPTGVFAGAPRGCCTAAVVAAALIVIIAGTWLVERRRAARNDRHPQPVRRATAELAMAFRLRGTPTASCATTSGKRVMPRAGRQGDSGTARDSTKHDSM
jgi:hypothetical protein